MDSLIDLLVIFFFLVFGTAAAIGFFVGIAFPFMSSSILIGILGFLGCMFVVALLIWTMSIVANRCDF